MHWIFIGILIAFGIWIGGFLIGVVEVIWPFLLGFVVLGIILLLFMFALEKLIEIQEKIGERIKDWPTVEFHKRHPNIMGFFWYLVLCFACYNLAVFIGEN